MNEINPIEFTIKAKAIFVDNTQVLGVPSVTLNINAEAIFRAVMNANDMSYISCIKRILYSIS